MHRPRKLTHTQRAALRSGAQAKPESRLTAIAGILALGILFGWLLAGCPDIAAIASRFL